MSLQPLAVDSIKDRIVCSVWALGDLATRANLIRSIECNGSVLPIAIDALVRDGYMHKAEGGWYVLDEAFAATLKPTERQPLRRNHAPGRSVATSSSDQTGVAMDTSEMKRCEVKWMAR